MLTNICSCSPLVNHLWIHRHLSEAENWFLCYSHGHYALCYPDSKVRGVNMGPPWVLSALDGPHVGPSNLPKQKWNVNSHSILTKCSPGTHLIRCALQVSTRWALQKWNGEQNISWVSDVHWVSTRWALGEYWQRCLRRCALGEYCICLEMCTRWALNLDNLCRWILGQYWTYSFWRKMTEQKGPSCVTKCMGLDIIASKWSSVELVFV